jgi:excisionase family DNA binding protein
MRTSQQVLSSDFLDLKQAETLYPISSRSIWKFIAEGRLPAFRPLGRKVLIRRADLDRLILAARIDAGLETLGDDVGAEVLNGSSR